MWDLLDVSGKGEARAAMEEADLATRVKGNKHNKVLVKERTTTMGLGENGYMTYRLGQSLLSFSSFPSDTTHSIGCPNVTLVNTQRHVCTD